MSEQTAKSGFQNKPLITNESNTARPQLWPFLKNKGGPQTLSSLFINLIDKRQTVGRVSGSSTFKPPPRVTMSNTRRESFLGELADPTFPMRKLNRSVPHTINGRVLLDQCLNKNIPIPRAVWLAKCIGANDFRAFKRKSATGAATMGSEAKWIKDWTIHVEQFLKSIVGSVGEPDWKSKIDYAIRLASHLFSEHLLDDEHYLEWLLSTLETASSQQLPIWLLFVQIYWSALTSARKRGLRLAESLLNHLEQLTGESSDDILGPIISKVESLIFLLATSHAACLILPRSWSRFREILQSLSEKSLNLEVNRAIETITRRNDRLSISARSTPGLRGGKSQLISILDTLSLTLTGNQLAERCLDVDLALVDLVTVVLRWASSNFRHGRYRVYVAARILRKAQQYHDDSDELLWDTIQVLSRDDSIDSSALYQVVVELARSSHFSIGRFVQHLISVGAFGGEGETELLQLLRHLPSLNLSDSTANMRFELLDSANLAPASDETRAANIKEQISYHFDVISTTVEAKPFDFQLFKDLSASQKFEIGHFVRQRVFSLVSTSIDNTVGQLGYPNPLDNAFFFARTILETFQEYPCLADVLGIFLDLEQQVLLTSVTHTLHYGYKCFIGMGAMKPLFNKVVSSYETIRNQQTLTRSFCSAILDLSTTLDANPSFISQLTQDLLRCDQLNSIAICSPASDNAGDIMQLSSADSDDEIERILSSGTTMDSHILHRVFDRIISRMEEAYKMAMSNQIQFGSWLARLRSFERISFDGMLRRYIVSRLATVEGMEMLYEFTIPMLSGSSCMSLAEYAAFIQGFGGVVTKDDPDFQLRSRIELVHALIPDATLKPLCSITVSLLAYQQAYRC
jgi:mediator of RNA polymerase II transcription subunit 12